MDFHVYSEHHLHATIQQPGNDFNLTYRFTNSCFDLLDYSLIELYQVNRVNKNKPGVIYLPIET